MITFIYPKDDWTASEAVMKMRAMAASQGYKVYSTPKNTKRNEEEIKNMLSKTKYSIFISYEAKEIDEKTISELNFLKKMDIEMYFVVTVLTIDKIKSLGFNKNIYLYNPQNPIDLIDPLQKILEEIKTKEQERGNQKDSSLEGIVSLIAILGLLFFFLWLVSKEE